MISQKAGCHRCSDIVMLIFSIAIIGCGILYSETEKQAFIATISYDTYGYYLYLPAFFIYKDPLHLQFIPEITERYPFLTNYFYQARLTENGNYVMNYTAGLSVLYLPFFCIGHLIAKLSPYPADGFSLPYHAAIYWGGVIWAIAGAFFLKQTLKHFFNDTVVAMVLVVLLFGSNYFYYAAVENAMPHNYLFTLYAILLIAVIRWHESFEKKYAFVMAITIGLAALIRPTEIIIALVPLLWGIFNTDTFKAKIKTLGQHWQQAALMTLVIIGIGCIQLIYWRYASGRWLYYSYAENLGFNFLHPEIIKGLFSIRKGWFIHTPLMLMVFPALIITAFRMKQHFPVIALYIALHIYITFSWSVWWYEGSYGSRPMIHVYPVLALAFGCLFQYIFQLKQKRIVLSFLVPVMAFFIFLNLFQTWQYANKFFSTEGINSYVWKLTFLKTKITRETIWEYQKLERAAKFSNAQWKTVATYDFENAVVWHVDSIYAYTGNYALQLAPQHRETVVFRSQLKNEKAFMVAFYGFFEQYVYEEDHFAVLKVTFFKQGKRLTDKTATLNNLTGNETITSESDYFGKAHTWYPLKFYFSVPPEADSVAITFHCRGWQPYNLDDLVIKISE